MDRRYSLQGRRSFERLRAAGKTWSSRGVRIRYLILPVSVPRFAISVPRRAGKAFSRNRLRRVFREAIRLQLPAWPGGLFHFRIQSSSGHPTRSAAARIVEDFRESIDA